MKCYNCNCYVPQSMRYCSYCGVDLRQGISTTLPVNGNHSPSQRAFGYGESGRLAGGYDSPAAWDYSDYYRDGFDSFYPRIRYRYNPFYEEERKNDDENRIFGISINVFFVMFTGLALITLLLILAVLVLML